MVVPHDPAVESSLIPSATPNTMSYNSRYKVPNTSSLVSRFFIEFFAILILVYPMLHIYVFLQGDMEPYKRGFFCNDNSIKYPNLPEEITVGECVLIWSCIVILLVPAIEFLHITVFEHTEGPRVWRIPWVFIELYRVLGYFALGALCTLLTTEMAKYKIGRLRPYFLSVCQVPLDEATCKDEHGNYKYVLDYDCAGDDHEVREASKSFLSGHSSFSFYCAAFLVVYIHARLSRLPTTEPKKPYRTFKIIFRGLKIVRPFLQFGIFCLAFYIALTRISDYKHHPGDVVMGAFVGLCFASIILFFLMDLFNRPRVFKMEVLNSIIADSMDGLPRSGESNGATPMRNMPNSAQISRQRGTPERHAEADEVVDISHMHRNRE